ncbi:MAG: MFS transporter, partial [Dehalococcoidia bacterium]|nr:MFS transporter [Dehalococcoidia bacterium]
STHPCPEQPIRHRSGLLAKGSLDAYIHVIRPGSGAGPSAEGLSPVPRPSTPEVAWTRREAMRTSALWLTILAFGLTAAGSTSFALHFYAFASDLGLSAGAAALAVSTQATTSLCAKLLWGFATDKFPVRRCGIAIFCFYTFGMVTTALLTLWPSFWLIYLVAAIDGFALGGTTLVQEVLWANYYGRLALGAIRSVGLPITIVFSASGPIFAGWVFDTFNSYQFAWIGFGLLSALGAILIFRAHPPKKGT